MLSNRSGTSQSGPYALYRYKVLMDGHAVAGFNKVFSLYATLGSLSHRSGGATVRLTSLQRSFVPVRLQSGITRDTDFQKWAALPTGFKSGDATTMSGGRKDIDIDVCNEAGKRVSSYRLMNCWVSLYASLPSNSDGNAVSIANVTLQNKGCARML